MRSIEPNRDPKEVELLREASTQARFADNNLTLLMAIQAWDVVEPYIDADGEQTEFNSLVTASLEVYDRCRTKYPGVDIGRAIKVCDWASKEIVQRRLEGLDEVVFEQPADHQPNSTDLDDLLERFKSRAIPEREAARLYKILTSFVADFQAEHGLTEASRLLDIQGQLPVDRLVDVVRDILNFSDVTLELQTQEEDE